MKKGKKCPKCNAPFSIFSLKLEKITDSLFCEKCDEEEVKKAVNSEWEKWRKLNPYDDPDKWDFHSSFYGPRRKNAYKKYIRRKPGT